MKTIHALEAVERRIPYPGDAGELLARTAHLEGVALLDGGGQPGHVSILGVAPVWEYAANASAGDEPNGYPFETVRARWASRSLAPDPRWPFTGGLLGWVGYDARLWIERLPDRHERISPLPDLLFRDYRALVLLDEGRKAASLIRVRDHADEAADAASGEAVAKLEDALAHRDALNTPPGRGAGPVLLPDPTLHEARIQRALEHIRAGDIYQVNLAQRFEAKRPEDAVGFYRWLRARNPAGFGAFIPHEGDFVASVSPERFLKIDRGRRITTRPIKGTRRRGETALLDEAAKRELLTSEKDRAELAMIVDILRNDLARVADVASVRVNETCTLESHPTVHHLVAGVSGHLSATCDGIDLLVASHPGGSITGAPRIRAMEIIDALEDGRRGLYTGCLGYLGFDGRMDLNILIRTAFTARDRLFFHGGGGIVADSDPVAEGIETMDKVRAFLSAFSLGAP